MSKKWKINFNDTRWVQLAFIIIFFVTPNIAIQYAVPAAPWTKDFYNEIEKLKPGDNVWIMWAITSLQDEYEVCGSVIRHIWSKGANIVWTDYSTASQPLAQRELTELWGANFKSNPELKYGTRFVYMGWLSGGEAGTAAFIGNPGKTMPMDQYKTPVSQLPLMTNLVDASKIKLYVGFQMGPFAGPGGGEQLVGLAPIYGYHVIYTAGTPQVGGAFMSRYVSRVVEGCLCGVRGAAEYATLRGESNTVFAYMNSWITICLLATMSLIIINIRYVRTLAKGGAK